MNKLSLKWGALGVAFWAVLSVAQAQNTAKDITERYYKTPRDCGSPSRPAFLCSGVLIRGTMHSPNYHTWDPSPASITDGGISFSYLRVDAKFKKLARGYTNGIIFYPIFGAPKDKMDPVYLCSFPMDAATDTRTDRGCGVQAGSPYSKQCQSFDQLTGANWYSDFTRGVFINTTNGYKACGFGVADHTEPKGGTANGFAATLDAMRLLGQTSFNDQNEIRVATWKPGLGKTLPIEAFFYLDGGRASAQADQKDLYQTDQVWVPVIKMTLPNDMSQDATFHYEAGDQAIPPK